MKKKPYIVLLRESFSDVEYSVIDLMKKGYIPTGGISQNTKGQYMQAMVLRGVEETITTGNPINTKQIKL
jgi:hypothetical protein